MVPGMETADPDTVWRAIKGKVSHSIPPHRTKRTDARMPATG